jgi:hypothetical protein
MRKLLMLAVVAALSAACHSRTEDEVGAAPEQAETDTTAVTADTGAVTHAIDSTRTGPPGVGGRPGDATVTLDSVGVDSAAVQGDTSGTGLDTTTTSTPQDTLGPPEPGAGAIDTTTLQSDTTGGWSDTTAADTSLMNQ